MSHHFSREVPTSRKRWANPAGVRRVPTGEPPFRWIYRASDRVSPCRIIDPAVYIRPADRRSLRIYDVHGKRVVNAAARRKGRAHSRSGLLSSVHRAQRRHGKKSRTTSIRWKDTFSAPLVFSGERRARRIPAVTGNHRAFRTVKTFSGWTLLIRSHTHLNIRIITIL